MSVIIRPMLSRDIDPIATWMLTVPLWQRYGLTLARTITQFETAFAQNDILLVAAEDDPVGFVWVMPHGAFGRSAYLRLIGVKPELAGQGIGAALLSAVEARVTNELFLLVSDFNMDGQRFYRRHGYAQIGIIPDYVVTGIAELLYWKRLGSSSAR